MKGLQILLAVLFFSAFSGCKKDSDSDKIEAFFGYQYAPLEIGQQRIYQVDSIIYNDFNGTVDTISFQKREVIESTFKDLEGKSAFRTKLYHRATDTNEWNQQFVFVELNNDLRYERRINNLPVIHLVFPVRTEVNWNPNALNTERAQDFTYSNLHRTFSYDSLRFDSTITVLQRDEENLIERIETQEKYATQVGLIYRYDEQLELDIQSGEIESGYKVTVKLIESEL